MSRELQPSPSVLSVSLVKIELPTVITNEPPESEIVKIGIDDILDSSVSEEEIIPDVKVKDIDIVYHPVCDDSIKSEILESKHCESVETQVLIKAENSPFIKTENITQRNKIEDTSNKNVTKGTDEAVVEVQAGSNQYSNVLSNLETDAQLVLNFSKDLNGISTRTRKSKQPEKTNFAKCYQTIETTSWKKDKEKIKVIKAPVIPVEAHEFTSLAKDKHICNHCQHACNTLNHLKRHIKKIHREVTTMYQCPYCPHKSKWSVQDHIILKHKDIKDIQWFQCNLCEMKCKLKGDLTRHMKVHLRYKQMKDGLDLPEKRYHCDNCDYQTEEHHNLKRHNLVHLKPEEIEYFYCYHCSFKYQRKDHLKSHIFRHHFKNVKQGKRHHCGKCNYETCRLDALKNHKLTHLKPKEVKYFYCYHCSYKTNRKWYLKEHIFRHFKNEQVKFDCYICNFMTSKRESIIKHIKKHSKVQMKSEINEGS